ncbi:hypothetical protein ACP4OV_012092 [Aristida adscensionis]
MEMTPPLSRELRHPGRGTVMMAEDGGLGFAGVIGSSLYLWSWKDGDDGTVGWVQSRVIELETLIPTRDPSLSQLRHVKPDVIGVVEGTDTIFLDTDAGLFTLELKAVKPRNVGVRDTYPYDHIVPYASFYAPVLMLRDNCHRLEDIGIHPLWGIIPVSSGVDAFKCTVVGYSV